MVTCSVKSTPNKIINRDKISGNNCELKYRFALSESLKERKAPGSRRRLLLFFFKKKPKILNRRKEYMGLIPNHSTDYIRGLERGRKKNEQKRIKSGVDKFTNQVCAEINTSYLSNVSSTFK